VNLLRLGQAHPADIACGVLTDGSGELVYVGEGVPYKGNGMLSN
jgi:hypothetical protein